MSYQYLIKSPRHLVQYLACNALPRGYHFYSSAWLPEDKDPVLVDAKLTLFYDCHLSKERQYRRRKAGLASVKYIRCGRLILLLATKGKSPFFEKEDWKDAKIEPIHVAGYSIRVNPETGKVSVRLHKEAQRKIRSEFTARAAWSIDWWEKSIRNFPFLSFAGIRDNLFAEIRNLNQCRKLLRLLPVDWKNCVRKKFKVEPVFLPSPPELLNLLSWHTKKGKSAGL